MMKKETLNVQGMSCGHCEKTVEGSVGELDGISHVKVNLEQNTVDVEYNTEKTSLEEIVETIDGQGYDVKE